MGLIDFELICQKDNQQLREDLKYYKNQNARLKEQLKEEKRSHEFDERVVEQHHDFVDKHYAQQKEFIKLLEDGMRICAGNNHYGPWTILKEVLRQYKKIIGDDKNEKC